MVDPAIEKFFESRKDDWLKKKVKASMSQDQITEVRDECEQVFSFENWLPNAAKRAGQISISTHPCTFSHPSARKNKNGYVSSTIFVTEFKADGFLKSGNADVKADALGNAAALDVYKFLTLEMLDTRPLLEHIQNDSELAKKLLDINSESYQSLKKGFLAMTENTEENVTSSKIKQVFFPVSEGYHQLSILSNSGLIYRMRNCIDTIRFSEKTKKLRIFKRNSEYSDEEFCEIYNISTIGYGGTKPQNISVLNNQNGGKSHLLMSIHPQIEKRSIRFPKRNFFGESFRFADCRDVFTALHKILKTDYNNINIREGRDYRIQELLDRIIHKMWAVRSVSENQYHADSSLLKGHQKTWLCHDCIDKREETDDWLEKLMKEISVWVIRSYEKIKGKQAIKLGEKKRLHILKIITQNKEALR